MTDRVELHATRATTEIAAAARGQHIGARAIETAVRTYTDGDLSSPVPAQWHLGSWMTSGRRDQDGRPFDSNGCPMDWDPPLLSAGPPHGPPAHETPTAIRQLTPDDWQLDREISLRTLAAAPAEYKTTFDEMFARSAEEWRRRAQARHAKFVALQNGEPTGAVAVVKHERPDTVELVSMFVAPEAQGSGASNHLIQSVVDWATDNDYRRVVLWVREENLRADNVYRRHGFGWTGREAEGPHGLRVEMYRLLGESDRIIYDTGRPWP
ncbi:GNAT family N-acetyltransferase [Nocardia sp. NPDC049149]|uniref:GNAT family N-acetyltransferase n=1 Tax=Nocardia sp. NPDC049149 TaxID=3364315 RepID=UPI00371862D4